MGIWQTLYRIASIVLWLLDPRPSAIANSKKQPFLATARARRWWAWGVRITIAMVALFALGITTSITTSLCRNDALLCQAGRAEASQWQSRIIFALVLAWVLLDALWWLLGRAAAPKTVWSRRRLAAGWIARASLLILLMPTTTRAASEGSCGVTNPGPCADNMLISFWLTGQEMVWNMINRPLLNLARAIESFRSWLINDVFGTAFTAMAQPLRDFLFIAAIFAVAFFAIAFFLQMIADFRIVDLRRATGYFLLGIILFNYGTPLVSAPDNARLAFGQMFSTIAQDSAASAQSDPLSTVSAEEQTNVLPPTAIYAPGDEPCPGQVLNRPIGSLFLNDYTANFLRADAVDIHCSNYSDDRRGLTRVPYHLGSNSGFVWAYANPTNLHTVFQADPGPSAQVRDEISSMAKTGLQVQLQAIVLSLLAVLEQLLHFVFALCVCTAWMGLMISVLFALYLPTEGLFQAQVQALIGIFKSSWVASFWMGILVGLIDSAADKRNGSMVFGLGLLGLVLVIVLIVGAGKLFKATLSAGGALVGAAPRAVGKAVVGAGAGVAVGAAAGLIAYRGTRDRLYAGGAAARHMPGVKKVGQAMLATGMVKPDGAFGLGLQSSRGDAGVFDWHTAKRHRQNLTQLYPTAAERESKETREQALLARRDEAVARRRIKPVVDRMMRDAAPNAALGATIPLETPTQTTPNQRDPQRGQMIRTPSGAPRRAFMHRQHHNRATPQPAGRTFAAIPAPSVAPATTPLPTATNGQGSVAQPAAQSGQAGSATATAISSTTPTSSSNGQGLATAPAAQSAGPRRTRTAAIPVTRSVPVPSATGVPALGAAAPAIRGADAVRQRAPTAAASSATPVPSVGATGVPAAAPVRRLRNGHPIAGAAMKRTARGHSRVIRPATAPQQRGQAARSPLQVPASPAVHVPVVAAAVVAATAPEQSNPALTIAPGTPDSPNEAATVAPTSHMERAANPSSASSPPAVQHGSHVATDPAGTPDAGSLSRSPAVARSDRRPTRQVLLQARQAGPPRASATTPAREVQRPGVVARANRRPQLTVLRVPSRRK